MARKKKVTPNEKVANWLIEHRWRDSLSVHTKMRMPGFVEESVMAAIYIVAGTSGGKVNVSPKLVFKCLMLPEISVQSVVRVEVGYDMSDRHARRLAQVVRFSLEGISRHIQESEDILSLKDPHREEINVMESKFIKDYYENRVSSLYSAPARPLPKWIEDIKDVSKPESYVAYGEAVMEYRKAEIVHNI